MINKKSGFTLIELLAVIVILGLLMAIAIPSVTKYITQSRKKTLTTTIDNYVGALTNQVNDMEYVFTATNTVYAIPIECIALERGGGSPFGEWMQANDKYWAYVLVQYDDITSSYTYGFTFKDSAGYGLYPTSIDKIQEDGKQIQQDLNLKRPSNGNITNVTNKDNWTGFVIDDNTDLHVLEAASEGEVGDGVDSCTLCQKGKNYAEVEEEKNNVAQNGNKYIMLNDTNQHVLINEENAENGIELYNRDTLVGVIPNSLITRSDNKIVVSGTGEYDGTYTICDDGYIEMNGMPVAKSAAKWVDRNEEYFLVIHNEIVYMSSDGNKLNEVFVSFEYIKSTLYKYLLSDESPFDFSEFKGYSFGKYNSSSLTLENIYDFLHLLNYESRCAPYGLGCAVGTAYGATGKYLYWGGMAYDRKVENAFVTYADWDASRVTSEQSQQLYSIEKNKKKVINLDSQIYDGVFLLEATEEKYFYKNNETSNIFYVDDYPFAYEKDMTWREWIHSDYSKDTTLNDLTGVGVVYIPVDNLDKKVSQGSAYGVGELRGVISFKDYILEGGGNQIDFLYCSGTIELPILKEDEYSKYGYDSNIYKFVGWQWDGGVVSDTIESYDFINYYIKKNNSISESYGDDFSPVFEKK